MLDKFLLNESRYLSVNNEDGHAFVIASGRDFGRRFQAALNEHFDGDCTYSADAFEQLGVYNNFYISVEVMQDGGETIYTTQIEAFQTWLY